MKLHFPRALFVALLCLAPVANARAADALAATFEAEHQSAQAANLPGVRCVLRAQNGQTRFQIGETIHLVAQFSSDRPGYKLHRYVRRGRDLATLGEIHVTPTAGAADPLGELPLPGGFGYSGPPPPAPIALGAKPFEIPFVLNDWVRFDQPGLYQIYLTTTRVFADKDGKPRDGFGFMFNAGTLSPTASEALQIEIVPTDAGWASAQVQTYREFWRKKAASSRFAELTPPRNDINFVGTREAMSAIIEHLSQNTRPRSSEDDTSLFRTGLIGFADRTWLIAEMKRAIERPNYAVTQGFFNTLTLLEGLQNAPRPAGADASRVAYQKDTQVRWVAGKATPAQQLQIDWQQRLTEARNAAEQRNWLQTAAAVDWKTGAARAMTLHSLLELAWLTNLGKEARVQKQLPIVVAQLAPVFDQLPPLPRVYLLGDQWDRIKNPAFVPALERLWKAPAPKTSEWDAQDAADLTLRRLYELDPKRGRALIVEQLRQPKPRAGFAALRVLPDATLPALDDILVANFEKTAGGDNTLAARLVWRYASAAAAPRLQKAFDASSERLDSAALEAMLAYFLRVAPTYGEAKLETTLRAYRPRDYSALLMEVAALQPSPELEQVAIAYLDDAGVGVEVDAAKMLARYGSSAAEKSLLARLKSTADAKYPKARAQIEPQLVEALANAQSWLCPLAKLRQIRALCRTDEGRRAADEYLRARSDGEPLTVNYSAGEREFWDVDGYSGRGLDDLRAKLSQFPRGTEFFWQSIGRGPDATRAFETTQKWASTRGLTVQSYEKIGARRAELGLR